MFILVCGVNVVGWSNKPSPSANVTLHGCSPHALVVQLFWLSVVVWCVLWCVVCAVVCGVVCGAMCGVCCGVCCGIDTHCSFTYYLCQHI